MRADNDNREKQLVTIGFASLLVVALIFYIIFILRTSFVIKGETYFTLVDDAMISMRYARNLAQGFGFVWNPGQPPIEGFTNLGWVFFMAVVHLFPIPPSKISLVIMLVSGLTLMVNALVVFQITSFLAPQSKRAPVIAGTVIAFYFPLVFWSLRGMEVGLLSLLICLATLLAFRVIVNDDKKAIPWLTLCLAAALIVRLDSFVQAFLILGYLIYNRRKNLQTLWLPILSVVATITIVLLFQKIYFGDFLPNTYYLKVAGISAIDRIKVGLVTFSEYAFGDVMMLFFFSLLGFALFRSMRTREKYLLFGLFAIQCVYSIWVGGDYAEELVSSANRFITQGMPALIILFSLIVDRLIYYASNFETIPVRLKQGFMPLAIAISVGTIAVISGRQWFNWYINNAPMLKTDITRVELGLHIKQYTSPQAVIAVHAAGQIPYYSERTTIDLLGKSDAVIAKGPLATSFAPGHDKWNYEYSILQLKPDVIADRFGQLHNFLSGVKEYKELNNGIYVRTTSQMFDEAGLSQEFRSP